MFEPHDARRVVVEPRRKLTRCLSGRRDSIYFELQLDLSRTLPWISAHNERDESRVTLFHLVLHALATVLHDRERLNRFAIGGSLYQRRGVFLSFAVRKTMTEDAPVTLIKREFERDDSFPEMVAKLTHELGRLRASNAPPKRRFVHRLPRAVIALSIRILRRLYAWGLAPRKLVDGDPLHTSAIIANLGSLGIDAAYHHLFEHGTCPLFVTIGQVTHVAVADRERIVPRPQLTIRFTFDERVEEGLYCARSLQLLKQRIEDPASWAEVRPRFIDTVIMPPFDFLPEMATGLDDSGVTVVLQSR
jgi:hypothetical protein